MIFENFTKSVAEIRKVLKIRAKILGVDYSSANFEDVSRRNDTACTAIATSFIRGKQTIINSGLHAQLCPGGDYFLKTKEISDKEATDVYVKTERVFKNNSVCKMFLKSLPKFPESLKNKNIIIGPLHKMKKAMVVIFLVTPAQAGRIIGLLNRKKYSKVKVIPNQSTCISLFAPLANGQLHINFIDYYDRYHQGIVCGKKIWPEEEMILSMTVAQFKEVYGNLDISSQGSFVRDLHPKEVDDI
ncbi:MAG: DUF169 domain-containing protein [Patescibacteria group bacterium]